MSRELEQMHKEIKAELERTACPVHGKNPQVTFTSDGIDINCCCEDFRQQTIAKYQEVTNEALRKQMLKAFKG